MKRLFAKLSMTLVVLALVAGCGKENSSGSSSSKSNISGGSGFGNASQNFQNIEQLRNAFNKKSMADGISVGADIYHVGNYFTGYSSGSGWGFEAGYQVSGCLNLIFWQVGDCDGYGSGDYQSYYVQQMEQIINNGRLLKVTGVSSNSVTAKKAVGVSSNGEFQYENVTLSRNSGLLAEMLSGDQYNTHLQRVQILLSNGQRIEGVRVLKRDFYNQVVASYVVTTNLPLAANPVQVQKNNGTSGYLSKVGQNISIQAIYNL